MSYKNLLSHIKKTTALEQVSGLLGWDQETQMPPKGGVQRAEHMGALESVLHARRTDERIPDWIAAIDQSGLNAVEKTNISEAQKSYDNATKIPADLAEALARLAAEAQGIWAKARAAENFKDFAPTLTKMVDLKREEASARQSSNTPLYDALMGDYEPEMSSEVMAEHLSLLRVGLTDLRGRIAESGRAPVKLAGHFTEELQMTFARTLPSMFGYDWDAGRMDMAVHPFCSGHGGDARITTRVSEINPFDCIYSTIHEVGHAVYEQNITDADTMAPAHKYASMGVHESQSRMFENQIGRSRAFCGYLFPKMIEAFGDIGVDNADDFYAAVNNVESGFIRTESDEVHYNLHVMMRFDLERALISGDLSVNDLEAAWNDRFKADFGREVTTPAMGVLQDVHWSVGLFGYFPTYSLGNIYAAELFQTMQGKIDNLDTKIAACELAEPIKWLNDNIHTHGRTIAPAALIANACGHEPTESALLTYLNNKFGELYNL
ncbi:MAG: carboxypeptidase M32 [Rhodobacteraceae bacterium]|nr:carboxypeptidase M32 [Paracoccaceae bacterium]